MIESFGYSSCTSCRKTEAQLAASGVEHTSRDFFKRRFTRDELKDVLERAEMTPSEVLSRPSKAYKADAARFDALDDDALIDELVAQPSLLRRPIVVDGADVMVGHNEPKLAAMIERSR